MEENKTYHVEDCIFFYETGARGPGTESEGEARNRAKSEGKKFIKVCCQETLEHFLKALKIGMTDEDIRNFKNALVGHQFEFKFYWKSRDTNEFDLNNWLYSAKEKIDSLSSIELQKLLTGIIFTGFKSNHSDDAYTNHQMKKFFQEQKENQSSQNPSFTTSRQVLALYYILEYAQLGPRFTNKTDLARLTQFLTGKEHSNPKISNTTIYKKWKALFGDSERKNRDDMRFIQQYFDKPGFEEINKMIQNDLDNLE